MTGSFVFDNLVAFFLTDIVYYACYFSFRCMGESFIAIYGLDKQFRAPFRKAFKGHALKIFREPLTKDDCLKETTVLGIFIDSPITKDILNALPRLKVIVTMSTGFDHIDIKETKKRGIVVMNVPVYGEQTVAEHAMALMLGLTRKLFPSVKRVKEGMFDYTGLRGMDISGKTVGIVGTGHIGMHVARMLRGFGATLLGYDQYPNTREAKNVGLTYTTLPKLLGESDIISLHLPLTEDTHHIFSKKAFQKMKPGAYLVNTARGGLIDSEALVWALEHDIVVGAGLDVLEDEAMVKTPKQLLYGEGKDVHQNVRTNLMNQILIDHPRVIITPHNAFNSTEAVFRIVHTTIENIAAALSGKPINVVGAGKRG